jgi:hypothetical protein
MTTWDETFRDIRSRFVVRTGEWVDEIVLLANLLEQSDGDRAALERLSVIFHRIAGSAGTYGFPQVSSLADEGELACIGLVREGRPPSPEDLATFRRLAEEIRERMKALRD